MLVGVSKHCISFTLDPLGCHPEILRGLETESRVSSLLCIWFYRNYTYSCLLGDAFCILRVFAQKYQIYFSVNNGQTTKLSYPPKPNSMLNKQAHGVHPNQALSKKYSHRLWCFTSATKLPVPTIPAIVMPYVCDVSV